MSALPETTMRDAPLVGRILMALIFLTSAYGKITGFDATAVAMAGKGMPVPQVLLVCAITIELIGSTLLVAGWYTRSAALALIVFLIPATLYFHNHWAHPPEQARNQRNHFMKNVTILGALIFVTGMGAGPLSVDTRARRP